MISVAYTPYLYYLLGCLLRKWWEVSWWWYGIYLMNESHSPQTQSYKYQPRNYKNIIRNMYKQGMGSLSTALQSVCFWNGHKKKHTEIWLYLYISCMPLKLTLKLRFSLLFYASFVYWWRKEKRVEFFTSFVFVCFLSYSI